MTSQPPPQKNSARFVPRLILICFLGIIGFFLITEHTAHMFGALPYLALLACPLMHILMHRHHGVHGDHTHSDDEPPKGGQ